MLVVDRSHHTDPFERMLDRADDRIGVLEAFLRDEVLAPARGASDERLAALQQEAAALLDDASRQPRREPQEAEPC